MHAVPRMTLPSSLFCCATFVLSVGLLFFFFDAELVFLRPCLFQRLVRNLSFFNYYIEGQKFESTSSGARVGIRTGVRETGCAGCMGVLVSGCFFCSFSFAFPRINHTRHNAIHIGHRMP